MWHALCIFAVCLCSATLQPVTAGWIDEDTPADARTVYSFSRPSSSFSHSKTAQSHFDSKTQPKQQHTSAAAAGAAARGVGESNAQAQVQVPFQLVFSDEFAVEGRAFGDGHDPRWTAIHKDDYTNSALHFYNEKLVSTSNGYLNISTVVEDITFKLSDEAAAAALRSLGAEADFSDGLADYGGSFADGLGVDGSGASTSAAAGSNGANAGSGSGSGVGEHKYKTKHYQSGMLQGWDKFCFTGGILEVRARLPGKAHVGGLWPAVWLMGNLARATYVRSSDNVWPWSYDTCASKSDGAGAGSSAGSSAGSAEHAEAAHSYSSSSSSAPQPSALAADLQRKQAVSACDAAVHYDLHPYRGRGAPEIDLLEAMAGTEDGNTDIRHGTVFVPSDGAVSFSDDDDGSGDINLKGGKFPLLTRKPFIGTSLQVSPSISDVFNYASPSEERKGGGSHEQELNKNNKIIKLPTAGELPLFSPTSPEGQRIRKEKREFLEREREREREKERSAAAAAAAAAASNKAQHKPAGNHSATTSSSSSSSSADLLKHAQSAAAAAAAAAAAGVGPHTRTRALGAKTETAHVGEADAVGDGDKAPYTLWYDHGLSYGVNSTLNVYFYGMPLDGSAQTGRPYVADTISANSNINEDHFSDFHTYRLEWQPRTTVRRVTAAAAAAAAAGGGSSDERYRASGRSGGDADADAGSGEGEGEGESEGDSDTRVDPGYLAWYLDGEFLYRIDGDALDLTGAIVPEEPMYIVLNTAISATWGFPTPCPDGCPYCLGKFGSAKNCYDCRNAACACSMPANMCENFPASFLIDYVRVYQHAELYSANGTSAFDNAAQSDTYEGEEGDADADAGADRAGQKPAAVDPRAYAHAASSGAESESLSLRAQKASHAASASASASASTSTSASASTSTSASKSDSAGGDVYANDNAVVPGPASRGSRSTTVFRKLELEPLGCSTPSHPTRTYIAAHKTYFMRTEVGDVAPLLPVPTGGGACDANAEYGSMSLLAGYGDDANDDSVGGGASGARRQSPIVGGVNDIDVARDNLRNPYDRFSAHSSGSGADSADPASLPAAASAASFVFRGPRFACGGKTRGDCMGKTCQCKPGYTGPQCLAYVAYDDIDYSSTTSSEMGNWHVFSLSNPYNRRVTAVFVLLCGALMALVAQRVKHGAERRRLYSYRYGSVHSDAQASVDGDDVAANAEDDMRTHAPTQLPQGLQQQQEGRGQGQGQGSGAFRRLFDSILRGLLALWSVGESNINAHPSRNGSYEEIKDDYTVGDGDGDGDGEGHARPRPRQHLELGNDLATERDF
jgi:beta-glucanase (GH16 family)